MSNMPRGAKKISHLCAGNPPVLAGPDGLGALPPPGLGAAAGPPPGLGAEADPPGLGPAEGP